MALNVLFGNRICIGVIIGVKEYGMCSQVATGSVQVIGGPHGHWLHRFATKLRAGRALLNPQVTKIYMNMGLKASGLYVAGANLRPDLVLIGQYGIIKIIEVVSPRQDIASQVLKINQMINSVGASENVGEAIKWVKMLFNIIP